MEITLWDLRNLPLAYHFARRAKADWQPFEPLRICHRERREISRQTPHPKAGSDARLADGPRSRQNLTRDQNLTPFILCQRKRRSSSRNNLLPGRIGQFIDFLARTVRANRSSLRWSAWKAAAMCRAMLHHRQAWCASLIWIKGLDWISAVAEVALEKLKALKPGGGGNRVRRKNWRGVWRSVAHKRRSEGQLQDYTQMVGRKESLSMKAEKTYASTIDLLARMAGRGLRIGDQETSRVVAIRGFRGNRRGGLPDQ